MGMILFLIIILLLSISSAYYLNVLSDKTGLILSENHFSVVYSREMTEDLTAINKEIVNSRLSGKTPDTSIINRRFKMFHETLDFEKNNITEVGEDKLSLKVETCYNEYYESVNKVLKSPENLENVLYQQSKFDSLYLPLMLLSKMNEKAIVDKTADAKYSSRKATLQMTFLGTICFLIAYGFTFAFSSYFNQRFYLLHNGIKEMVSGSYNQRIILKGNDELSEISAAFNEMAEKLSENKQKMSVTLPDEHNDGKYSSGIKELKTALQQIKTFEEKSEEILSRLEKEVGFYGYL